MSPFSGSKTSFTPNRLAQTIQSQFRHQTEATITIFRLEVTEKRPHSGMLVVENISAQGSDELTSAPLEFKIPSVGCNADTLHPALM